MRAVTWYGWGLLLLLTSCSDHAGRPPLQMFRFNLHVGVTSLDPAFASSQANIWVVDQLYEGLVSLDDSLRIRPALARRWTVSDDGLTYTFFLRSDVYFHDSPCFGAAGRGRKLVAQDVAYSFRRLVDPGLKAKGSWIFEGKTDSLGAFTAVDDTTFVLRLRRPFRPMLEMLGMAYCRVVPQEAVEYYGSAFRTNAVGTGPFRLVRWRENQTMVLHRHSRYHGLDPETGAPLPYLDGVRIYFMPERQTAFFQFARQKLHLLSGLESTYINELLDADGGLLPKWHGRIRYERRPYLNTEYLGIYQDFSAEGMADHPLRHPKVRQALNWGIDRRAMLRTLRNGIGRPAEAGFSPYGLPSFHAGATPGYGYDPERARALLAESGFPGGRGLSPFTLHCTKEYADLCSFLIKQWGDIGLQVRLEVLDGATLRSMRDAGKLAFFRGSWIADYPDAENYFALFYGKNPSPPNFFRFRNEAFDEYYEASLGENDDEVRYALYQKMDRLLIEEAPVIFLFYDEVATFVGSTVEGLSTNALNQLDLKRTKLSSPPGR
jgi:oligopeptide transport system substrate-binding protein